MIVNLKRLIGKMEVSYPKLINMSVDFDKPFKGYKKIVDNNCYSVYKVSDLKPSIVAAFGFVVVTKSKSLGGDVLSIYPDFRKTSICYRVGFNNKNFPDLLPGSKILNCFVIPYMRECTKDRLFKRWRLVVVTDKCQVFHNFPARSRDFEGYEVAGDIKRFSESAVWDIPGRKYPSKNKNCDERFEEYYPCLPDSAYEYHPAVNCSKYGDAGFDKFTYITKNNEKIPVSRFYFPLRKEQANPFFYMGGYEPDYKMTLIGTYRSNKDVGARTCVFATSDGGRNFYAKYEFSDEGVYDFKQGEDTFGLNYGNLLDGSVFGENYAEECFVSKRKLVHENNDLFEWEKPVKIKCIEAKCPIVVNTAEPHSLCTGNIVCLSQGAQNKESLWDCMFNNGVTNTSCGNGRLYKVVVKDENSFEIYENVSNPYNNIACRHIHHINRVRDGWVMGTGEIYPNGWMYYIQMKQADTFSRIGAWDDLTFLRLTDAPECVQRTAGADLIDGEEQMFVFASDHDTLPRPKVECLENISFSRNSTGVYAGKLRDINDFDKFKVVYEAKEPSFFFKKLSDAYVFGGMRGELALGFDSATKWISSNTGGEPLIHYYGSTLSYHVIDNFIIRIK